MNLKKFLKNLKLKEEGISMILGALVIVIVGILVVNYFKDKNGQTLPEALTTTTDSQKAQAGGNYTVVKDDSLWSIAEQAYGSGYNWVDIYSENKLSSEQVDIGQTLKIPEVQPKTATTSNLALTTSGPTATPVVSLDASPAATPESAVAPRAEGTNVTSYTVVKGDSLWKIAVKEYGNGNKWVEIARANKLVNPNIIHSGNVLTLPR